MESWRENCNEVKLIKNQISFFRMNVSVTVDHSVGKNILGKCKLWKKCFYTKNLPLAFTMEPHIFYFSWM